MNVVLPAISGLILALVLEKMATLVMFRLRCLAKRRWPQLELAPISPSWIDRIYDLLHRLIVKGTLK